MKLKITVFTGNGIRHNYLINELVNSGFEVCAIKEIPLMMDEKKQNSKIMDEYFSYVKKAEKEVFDLSKYVKYTEKIVEYGKLNDKFEEIKPFLESDCFIVFGSSYIKGQLMEILEKKRCINLHMGVSPYYRGSACNFWAQYDNNFNYIGGTIHFLSKGLDSGDIIKTVTLKKSEYDRFEVGMVAVKETIDELVNLLKANKLFNVGSYKQNKELEMRYSRIKDFTEKEASEFIINYNKNPIIKI